MSATLVSFTAFSNEATPKTYTNVANRISHTPKPKQNNQPLHEQGPSLSLPNTTLSPIT